MEYGEDIRYLIQYIYGNIYEYIGHEKINYIYHYANFDLETIEKKFVPNIKKMYGKFVKDAKIDHLIELFSVFVNLRVNNTNYLYLFICVQSSYKLILLYPQLNSICPMIKRESEICNNALVLYKHNEKLSIPPYINTLIIFHNSYFTLNNLPNHIEYLFYYGDPIDSPLNLPIGLKKFYYPNIYDKSIKFIKIPWECSLELC
jgi:hypothetical protein